ncbi:MAG: DUF4160 domain-containing protein [Sphingomonadaceae bacterium]|nr:DUF4160 domain-containing protein [Sphingomonadaceae bacterium]
MPVVRTEGLRLYSLIADDHPRGRVRDPHFTLDHPPPHVHVAKAGAVVKIDLATCQIIEIVGTISDREAKHAEALVAKHAQRLKKEWTTLHGKQSTHRH